jgi:NAD(P)-dependent dehydrogenase (short-subunit alcohol dehydrogenase family)
MRLDNHNAIIYGAGGAIGGAVARAFAREGAKVYLTGRTHDPVAALAKDITAEGGSAEAAQVDAMDAAAVRAHADDVVARHGGIDISFNWARVGSGSCACDPTASRKPVPSTWSSACTRRPWASRRRNSPR